MQTNEENVFMHEKRGKYRRNKENAEETRKMHDYIKKMYDFALEIL